ncbi:MAG: hypothetical protein U0Q16_22040 [Bryobacteraceae bacterium]
MKAYKLILPVVLFAGLATAAGPAVFNKDATLDNEGLVMLARAGYNERFLLELIRAKTSRFDTSVEGLVYFAKNGVSERVVRAILLQQREARDREALATPLEEMPSFAPEAPKAPAPAPVAMLRKR